MRSPDDELELLRMRVRAGDLAGAREVVVPGLHGQRGALAIALAERRGPDALDIAGALAEAGWWDPEVAATIVAFADEHHPLAPRAASIVEVVTAARSGTIDDVAALVRDVLEAGALLEAFLAAEEAIRRWPERAELWGVVALTRNEIGDDRGAHDALRHAAARDASSTFVVLVEAHLASPRDREVRDARLREARATGVTDDVVRVIEAAGIWAARGALDPPG